MNRKEQNMATILNRVMSGQFVCGLVADVLEISLCHLRQILANYVRDEPCDTGK